MSSLHDNPFLLASGSPTDPTFPVQRSVRLRSSASAYFNRTPASAGNRKTWTWSAWVKRGALTGTRRFIAGTNNTGGVAAFYFEFDTSERLNIGDYASPSWNWQVTTSAVFRDPSAWYHISIAFDTTQATSSNRVKLSINGVQQTALATAAYPSLNYDGYLNSATLTTIGDLNGASLFFDGYLTEVNFIDGQALTPTSFGSYNAGSGVWQPIRYSGTYGTNGFYLNFQDNSAATATTIGKDSSGNSNNWTPNNISVTAGVTYDSMLDVPTLTSNTNANFPTLNPLFGSTGTLSNANLSITSSGAGNTQRLATMAVSSGKWYYEVTFSSLPTNTDPLAGFTEINNTSAVTQYPGQAANAYSIYSFTGNTFIQKVNNNTFTNTNTTIVAQGNIIGVALDLDNNKIWFAKNNVWVDSGDPAAGTNSQFTVTAGTYAPSFRSSGSGGTATIDANFGQRPFSYTPPTGFKSLNTYNLPDPTIPSGDDFHKVYTYTGNGGGLQVGEIQKPASLFNLDRSLRLRSSASAYLSRTPASAGSLTTWTWSGWVKPSTTTGFPTLFAVDIAPNDQNFHYFYFANGALEFIYYTTSTIARRTTTQLFRDPAIWYHLVFVWDTTNATASNRMRIYVNGVQQTLFSSSTDPSLNLAGIINSTNLHTSGNINYNGTPTQFYDGYLADVYFIDGQALAATDFGAYDGNYYWTPKAYTGTYGTNGFHLEFEDNSAATAAAIGKDTSGNVNNWTPTNISVTAGATYDSMTDVPTQTSTDVANFATLNPLTKNGAGTTISNGNLTSTKSTSSTAEFLHSTIGVQNSGSYYWEITPTTITNNGLYIGLGDGASSSPKRMYWWSNGNVYNNAGTVVSAGGSYVANDVLGFAYNVSSDTLSLYKNNTLTHTITNVLTNLGITSGTGVFAYILGDGASNGYVLNANFGQRPFTYTPPTGFKSVNSFNIAEVTTDLETPDFVWIKSRSAATSHALFNSVTGVGKYMSSNSTAVETTDVNSLIQFNKNGFLLGNAAIVNTSAATYVASAWKAGGTAVTNTAGSITSQVSANQKAGFSIVTYTGTGANATVGHGLGVAPKMILVKGRNLVSDGVVYHASVGNTGALLIDSTIATSTSINYWNNTSPTSSVFTIGIAGGVNNSSSNTYVAYCFSEIAGFSKFGNYNGNGSADGIFVHTGFRPRWVMIKSSTGAESWYVYDSSRNTYNVADSRLYPNLSSAEGTGGSYGPDLLSNGFKTRTSDSSINLNGGTYIYAAFAENPFKYSLAR